ncbi:hypothetical protein F5984_09125 [Rudanella paleaurantiibacter]|uniref:Uncharacterized protein n=1 Tax=Rudanella paleaurantiibacter TaxID=2614655 RepID=A0A7J5TZR6_9BACT|nr:hypothetical protein [Rudanella paleaurantiibacter]KAB7730982.1 hypothetical protein F5984_09125 [Rudanella paleaurantiibacter]
MADIKPQVALHEGGQVTERYISRNEAIRKDGETGCLAYLCDKANIPLINGDMSDTLEYQLMLGRYPKSKLFLYYIMERTVIPHLTGANGTQPFEEVYRYEIPVYFVNRGFPLSENERSYAYFKELYERHIGRPFKLELTADVELFDYVNGKGCEFCALGRASKMVRDSVLLTKIDRALDQYDRVLVTFGGGHALALEPALKQLIRRKRQP